MKSSLRLCLMTCTVLALGACQAWETNRIHWSSLSVDQALDQGRDQPRLALAGQKLRAWGGYLQKLGIAEPSQTIRISTLNQDRWGSLRIAFSDPSRPGSVLRRFEFNAQPSPDSRLVPALHLRPWIEEPAPFLLAWLDLKEDRQIEWYFIEAAGLLLKPKGTAAQTDTVRAFLASKWTSDFINRTYPGNQSLSTDYLSVLADRRTFAILVSSLQETVTGLINLQDPPETFKRKFDYQIKAWLEDFRALFKNRFQSNEYRDFGQADLTLLDLYALDPSAQAFGDLERKYAILQADAKALIASWNGLDNSAAAVTSWLKD